MEHFFLTLRRQVRVSTPRIVLSPASYSHPDTMLVIGCLAPFFQFGKYCEGRFGIRYRYLAFAGFGDCEHWMDFREAIRGLAVHQGVSHVRG